MENKSFEEWFDAFVEFVRGYGYNGFIDKESAMNDYFNNIDAMEAAKSFVDEMND